MNINRANFLQASHDNAMLSRADLPLAAKLPLQPIGQYWASERIESWPANLAAVTLFCLANSMVVFVFARAIFG
jgi:hypothetical protein